MAKKYPARWTFNHGAFYYVVPPGERERFGGKAWYRLGSTEAEAYQKWAKLLGDEHRSYSTMGKLFDRYMAEIAPAKAPATYRGNIIQVQKLRAFFGAMTPKAVKTIHVYQYLDIRQKTPVAANREVALLSHVFTKAIRWGAIEVNPCVGKKVEKNTEKPRDRYVTDDEFATFYNDFAGQFLQAYLKVKYLIGQRKSDVLRIKLSDITGSGIRIIAGKTGKAITISWSDELKDAVAQAKAVKRRVGTMYLFATRTGQCYVKEDGRTSGFDSIWQRRMNLFVEKGNMRFNEQDIRAKTASDTDAEHAYNLMMHRSKEFTEKVYRRGENVVSPLGKKDR